VWRVLFDAALERWEQGASDEQVVAFLEWVLGRTQNGPPTEGAVRVPLEEEELFVNRIQVANAVVTYYVVTWERLIIVKDIESA
jgi:hypothetical protein